MNNIDIIKNKIKEKKHILLSLDLDDTFVNRSKGDNYVREDNKALLKRLLSHKNVTTIINTGRERYGYESFCRVNDIYTNNAVLGSGSVVQVNGTFYFDEHAAIEQNLLDTIKALIKDHTIPFMDMAHFYDRTIMHGYDPSAKLFFAQNPTSWFDDYPKIAFIDEPVDLSKVFRIEFPLALHYFAELSSKLDDKKHNWFSTLLQYLPKETDLQKEYFLKRKSNFKGILENEYRFCRIEVDETVVNKGTGLKKWIEQQSTLKDDEYVVVHIGDKDSGIVNDTIIKSEISNSIIVMVGEDFDKANPLVDTYFEDEIDDAVAQILHILEENYVS